MPTASSLLPGTPVLLADGSIGHATPDRRVGATWDGLTYRVGRQRHGRWIVSTHQRVELTPLVPDAIVHRANRDDVSALLRELAALDLIAEVMPSERSGWDVRLRAARLVEAV